MSTTTPTAARYVTTITRDGQPVVHGAPQSTPAAARDHAVALTLVESHGPASDLPDHRVEYGDPGVERLTAAAAGDATAMRGLHEWAYNDTDWFLDAGLAAVTSPIPASTVFVSCAVVDGKPLEGASYGADAQTARRRTVARALVYLREQGLVDGEGYAASMPSREALDAAVRGDVDAGLDVERWFEEHEVGYRQDVVVTVAGVTV